MASTPLSFAEQLRTHREAAGLSQYALAKKSGLSKQAMSRLEMGEREPSWTTVQLLAKALGVSCEAFTVDVELPADADKPPRGRGRPPKPRAADPPPKRPAGKRRKKP